MSQLVDAGSRPAQRTPGHAVTRPPAQELDSLGLSSFRGFAKYALELVVIWATYFILAKIGSLLASIDASAVPIWPPTGFALAVILLRGVRVWPAIFAAVLAANATTDVANMAFATSISTSLGIAAGNTLAAVIGGHMINTWSDGRRTLDTPTGIAKFVLIAIGPSAIISASIGVGTFYLAGQIEWANFATTWATWWLRDIASTLVIAPVIILWAISDWRSWKPDTILPASLAFFAALLVGLIAFSPLVGWTNNWSTLSCLAALPLLWAALRCEPRDTATTALILSCLAVWGALMGVGPFAVTPANAGVLPLVIFMSCASVLSLIVSADVTARKRSQAKLHLQERNLRAMFGQAAVGIAQADTTGRFTVVNDRFLRDHAAPDSATAANADPDLYDPEQSARHIWSAGTRTPHRRRIRYRKQACVARSLAAVGQDVTSQLCWPKAVQMRHLMVVAEDITARRQAEENLLERAR